MQKEAILLILLGFILLVPEAYAQQASFLARPAPSKSENVKNPNVKMIPFNIWEEKNQHIKNNLHLRINTFPLLHRPNFQLDIGPGQFRIRIPFS